MAPTVHEVYLASIQRVLKTIDEHIDEELCLERLAEVAYFSKYHFHRIFKGAVGETLQNYVSRRRLERAVFYLKHQPQWSVTEVALRVGYQSPEHFSRSFKKKFGFSARQYSRESALESESLKNSKIYQELSEESFYHVYQQSRALPKSDFVVHIKDRETTDIAFISESFGDDGSPLVAAYLELMDWLETQSFMGPQLQRFAISRNDIEVTPAEQYRLEFCASIPKGTKNSGRVQLGQIQGGLYALIPVKGDIHKVAQAWDYLYKNWLPRSQFFPRDEPALEIFLQGPETIGWDQFDLEIGVPVRRIS